MSFPGADLLKTAILLSLLISTQVFAKRAGKLLDGVAGIFNDKIITYSMLRRVKKTQKERRQISPFIFKKKNLNNSETLNLIINTHLVRAGLKEIGYIINDEQVESSINNRQRMIGISRDQLVSQINSFGLHFDEYYELIRGSIEHNLFTERIIKPLISITDQEIKNQFFKTNSDKAISAKYKLYDFLIPINKTSRKNRSNLPRLVAEYRENGTLNKVISDIDSVEINDLNLEDVKKSLRKILVKTGEGEYSKAYEANNYYHVYYVVNIELVESELFQELKPRIKRQLTEKAATKMQDIWYQREREKHFIKLFL